MIGETGKRFSGASLSTSVVVGICNSTTSLQRTYISDYAY
jgi:hypothetical protein